MSNNLRVRELALQQKLRENHEEVWETPDADVEKLAELKVERQSLELELGEVRLSLYCVRRTLDNEYRE